MRTGDIAQIGESKVSGGQRWKLHTHAQISNFRMYADEQLDAGKPITVSIATSASTEQQNHMQWALYRDIAAHLGDQTTNDIQAYCKLHFGVAILKAADPEFAAYYDAHFKGLTYEAKLGLMDYIDITSSEHFKKPQMTEYLTEIVRYWTQQGVPLAIEL